MRIAMINGSPKVKNSASGALLEDIKYYFSKEEELVEVPLHGTSVSEDNVDKLNQAQAWIISCPLYVDGLPAHLLSCLVQLEEQFKNAGISLYGVVNCGFYEGIQAEFALKIMENWCKKTGNIWGGGVGVGGGGGLSMMPKMELGQGPNAPIDEALQKLAVRIQAREKQENNYVTIGFPRFLYKMGA